jgi:hypothetical protein
MKNTLAEKKNTADVFLLLYKKSEAYTVKYFFEMKKI